MCVKRRTKASRLWAELESQAMTCQGAEPPLTRLTYLGEMALSQGTVPPWSEPTNLATSATIVRITDTGA